MKKIALIDGNSLMYRAYYATAYSNNLMKTSKGVYTNLVFSFSKMFEKILSSSYDGILIAFDKGKKTFRHEQYVEYKGKRSPMPDEMRMQIPLLEKYLEIIKIKTFKKDLYEADDIIGTVAKLANLKDIFVDIYSSDKDLLQLINKNTNVCLIKKGLSDLEIFDEKHFREIYNLVPSQMIDLKGLMGDASDNIKGIKGIGEKTALKLLEEYTTIENLIENRENLKGSTKDKVCENYPDAISSKMLCTIYKDVELDFDLSDLEVKKFDNNQLIEFYKEMEFFTLLKNMKTEKEEFHYTIINNSFELAKVLLNKTSIYLELDSENYFDAKLLGIGISNKKGNFYIKEDLFFSIDFQVFLSDKNIEKSTFDYKKLYVFLKINKLEIENVKFDLLLATYILNPNKSQEEFKIICENYNYSNVNYDEEVFKSKTKKEVFESNILEEHICKKAFAIYHLENEVMAKLKEQNQLDLFSNIELPLSKTLGNMEIEGIKVDMNELNLQNDKITIILNQLEKDIKTFSSDQNININSVKQLGIFLFEELKLKVIKKTKTGYSTDNDTLEKLKDEHEVVEKIMDYRTYSKLKSTYLDGIKFVLRKDNIVNTIYKQTLTQTGRLSSIEPNLQNIPVKTEVGKNIRKIFVPKNKNNSFLACDYSQIELRVLAHMANVKGLIESFNKDEDIHKRTAMEVFNTTSPTEIERKRAKAVNFGIVYGISSFGLANDLNITRKDADLYIKKYFEIYPEINKFMEEIIHDCEKNLYVKTLFNRRRYINDINANFFQIREYAKRTAMNAPIQGTAADIIKIAMIKIDEKIHQLKLNSKMILQVHDELIFEVIPEEMEKLKKMVIEEMENAVTLKVPLRVSFDIGNNWYEV